MPTGKNSAGNSWYDIIRGKPKYPIQIEQADGSVVTISTSEADKGSAFVLIEKDNKYYFGLLLLRDASFIPKEGNLQYWGKTSQINNITYEEYLVLKEAGCLFLCNTGYYSNTFSQWRYFNFSTSDEGGYWSASNYENTIGYRLGFFRNPVSVGESRHSTDNFYIPVRLVKKMN